MVPKFAFMLFPLARRADPRHATFITLLMSTGLTFGTISSLYGLNAGIIDKTQFSLLVTVVVLSAVVPTAIAERWFLPDVGAGPRRPAQRLAASGARLCVARRAWNGRFARGAATSHGATSSAITSNHT